MTTDAALPGQLALVELEADSRDQVASLAHLIREADAKAATASRARGVSTASFWRGEADRLRRQRSGLVRQTQGSLF